MSLQRALSRQFRLFEPVFHHRRNLVSKPPSRTSSTTTKDKPHVFQEKTERATQLHQELEGLMQNHYKRIREDQARPAHQSFFSFLRKNRREMINIGATFVCTILAYQIVGLRKANQKLENQLKEGQRAMQEKQALLQSLTTTDFVEGLAQQCNDEIRHQARQQSSRWGRQVDVDHSTELIAIIQQSLASKIGDAGLSDEEKRDQIMLKLQQAQDDLVLRQQLETLASEVDEKSTQVELKEDVSGATVVKRRKFSI